MMTKRLTNRVAAAATLVLLVLALMPGTALAATIAVNETADELNTDGDCSLREAIQSANTDAAVDACAAGSGNDTITLPAGTYTLSVAGAGEDSNATGDLDITSNVAVSGAGASTTTINGGAIDRVLHVLSGNTLALTGVTVTNGSTSGNGAGLFNSQGTLTLTDSTVTANASTNGNSGGIYSFLATTTLTNSTVSDNTSQFDGAGLFKVGGEMTLTGSTVSGNAGRNGGGIKSDNGGTLTLTNSTVSGNTAEFGAGINNDATLNMTGSTISGNTASSAGGGIFTNFGTLTITNSTLSGNIASGSSGGGGIYSSQATIAFVNSTVASNTTAGTNGGGLRGDTNATYTFKNTIVANSTGGDCFGLGTFTTLGYNIDSDNTCSLTHANDKAGVNPVLGPLADNGGLTKTHALLSGSPALDAGDNAAAPTTDQRGTARPQGSVSDIGAFELQVATAVPALSLWGLLALAGLTLAVLARRLRGRAARA